jgi:hypothetical protein
VAVAGSGYSLTYWIIIGQLQTGAYKVWKTTRDPEAYRITFIDSRDHYANCVGQPDGYRRADCRFWYLDGLKGLRTTIFCDV